MIVARASARVLSVEERFETVRGYKDPITGQTVTDRRSLGWFIRITESSAICVGRSKPDVAEGDELVLTLEKA